MKEPDLVLEAANDLEQCLEQIADNRYVARNLVRRRSDAQLLWRPALKSWSIAECLLHLNRSGLIYLGAIDRAMARGRRRGLMGTPPFHHPWFSRWFVSSFEPPPKRRFAAPRMFLPPAPEGPVSEIVADFEHVGEEIAARIDTANGLDLGRIRVISPITPLVRLSLGMAFALLAVHERRHLDQARRVADAPDFPRA